MAMTGITYLEAMHSRQQDVTDGVHDQANCFWEVLKLVQLLSYVMKLLSQLHDCKHQEGLAYRATDDAEMPYNMLSTNLMPVFGG